MKKILLVAAAAAGLASVAPAFAADGTITVTGNVVANTCRVAGTSGANVAVTLPSVQTISLAADGQTAATTPFQINVSACTPGTKALAFFEPTTAIDPTTNNLRNLASGGATNVQVRLLNSDLSQILLSGIRGAQSSQQITTDSAGAGALNYFAQYFATGASTAGSVSTNVQYTMVYN
jgi:major type 1 subunit fimbrin (pilin)